METPSFWISFLAGVGYFFSPCTLPLVPSYLIYLSGVSLPAMVGTKRLVVVANAAAFLAGLLFLFVAAGASATFFGNLLARHIAVFRQIGGGVIVLFGVLLLWKPPFLYRLSSRQTAAALKPAGLFGSFLVGLSFSAAWTGCSTPILGAILMTAAVSDTVQKGITLLLLFGLGMAIPFLLCAFFLDILLVPLRRLQHHIRKVEICLGCLFILFGGYLIFHSLPFLN